MGFVNFLFSDISDKTLNLLDVAMSGTASGWGPRGAGLIRGAGGRGAASCNTEAGVLWLVSATDEGATRAEFALATL